MTAGQIFRGRASGKLGAVYPVSAYGPVCKPEANHLNR